jgi:hypothetical protein
MLLSKLRLPRIGQLPSEAKWPKHPVAHIGQGVALSARQFGRGVKRMEAVEPATTPRPEVIDSESRRYPRFEIQLPIEYWQIKPSITHTGNLSEGGALIYFPRGTDLGQHLTLKLFFPLGSRLKAIKALAEVVWIDHPLGKHPQYCQYGVKFVQISSQNRNKLKLFLTSLASPLDDIIDLSKVLRMGP